jgi:DNA polymerase sigma
MIVNFLQTREPPILPKLHEIPHDLSRDNIVMNGLNTSFYSDVDSLQDFGKDNHETVGGLFYAFFRKYGFEFDYKNQVISVRSGRLIDKMEKGWHKGIESQRLLCIEEPFDVRRNLGNSADEASVKGLQREFQICIALPLQIFL